MASPFQLFLSKTVIGADLSSSQWADVPLALRERSLFSARMENARLVQGLKDMVESILNPQQERRADRVTPENPEGFVTTGDNLASARVKAKQELRLPRVLKRGSSTQGAHVSL